MIYPEFIHDNELIGVTALSGGLATDIDKQRAIYAQEEFAARNINITKTDNVHTDEKGRSSDAKTRAKELAELVDNPQVKVIMSAAGGDYLLEMLPYIDYDAIVKNPKWYQGYSDPTGLIFGITTKYDIATVYSNNFAEFSMNPWHKALEDNLKVLRGENIVQTNFNFFQNGFIERETGKEPYNEDAPVKWSGLHNEQEIILKGRILGGCLDVISFLIGTPYQDVKGFIEKYKDDGIVWCLESFSITGENLTLALWQLRNAGWFENAKGFIFGRPCFYQSFSEITFEEAVQNAIGDMGLPIITGADIGHKKPSITIVNGAIGEFSLKNGKAELRMEFR